MAKKNDKHKDIFNNKSKVNHNDLSKPHLSKREIEVLQLAADGMNNKEVANKLGISIYTVDSHNRNVVQTLDAKNMKEAVAIGIRKRIIF